MGALPSDSSEIPASFLNNSARLALEEGFMTWQSRPRIHLRGANPRTNARNARWRPLSMIRARHGRHVFINALRNAHKMAFSLAFHASSRRVLNG